VGFPPSCSQPRRLNLQNSLRLAEFPLSKSRILLIRLEEIVENRRGGSPGAGLPLLRDARLPLLENKVGQAPSLVEISIAGDDNRILVSSTRSNSGPLCANTRLPALLALGPSIGSGSVFGAGLTMSSASHWLLDDPSHLHHPVLVSDGPAAPILSPRASGGSAPPVLPLSLFPLVFVRSSPASSRATSIASPRVSTSPSRRGVPELNTHRFAEFAAVQSKLSLLGPQRYGDTRAPPPISATA